MTTTVRLNHTSSSGTKGDGRDQKEKFIDFLSFCRGFSVSVH